MKVVFVLAAIKIILKSIEHMTKNYSSDAIDTNDENHITTKHLNSKQKTQKRSRAKGNKISSPIWAHTKNVSQEINAGQAMELYRNFSIEIY